MRVRNAGAAARLLLVLVLMAGTVISGLPPDGAPVGSPRDAVAVKAKNTDRGKDKAKTDSREKDKDENAGNNDKDKKKSKDKQRRGKRAPAPLDTERIAAEKADTLDALECGDLITIRVDGRVFCTHGEDPEPPGADLGVEAETAADRDAGPAAQALCIDDGISGPRVQMVYVHRNGHPNRLDELAPTLRRLASEMDTIFDQSARKTGDSLRVRYVTDETCRVDIEEIAVPPGAVDDFGSLIQRMQDAGHDQLDRKYLMMVDASVFCGVGTFAGGGSGDEPNTEAHDFTGYARVDLPCWDAGSMAHELSHTLGAVQNSAPNTSRGGHCIDEWDVLCYSDEPFKPKMRIRCDDGAQDFRLDCGNDDYYAARPRQGSYLDRHWNMADSHFLTLGSGPTCVDAGLEPDDAFWYDYWKAPMPEFPVGERQERAFCAEAGDTDWALIRAERGISYAIETTDLGPGVDTQLVLYRGFEEQRWDGMDEFAVNDDRAAGDPSSTITFTAPADGSFLVGVADANDQAGFERTYTLSIEETDAISPLALSLSRSRTKPGGTFTVTVRNLTPESPVTIWRQRKGQSIELGEATSDAAGTATATFTVPRGLRRGSYQIEAITENRSVATATLKVLDSQDGKKKGQGKGGENRKSQRGGKDKR